MLTAIQAKRLGTITLQSDRDLAETRPIRLRTRCFVIHRPAFAGDGIGWTVTHERSKLRAVTVRRLALALELAGKLEELGNWDSDNPTQECKDLIAPAYELCKAYR